MNMERNYKTGGERGRKGNSHLAFYHWDRQPTHTVNGTKASNVTLGDPEMKGNSCFRHQTFPLSLTDANKKITWVFKRLSCWVISVEE